MSRLWERARVRAREQSLLLRWRLQLIKNQPLVRLLLDLLHLLHVCVRRLQRRRDPADPTQQQLPGQPAAGCCAAALQLLWTVCRIICTDVLLHQDGFTFLLLRSLAQTLQPTSSHHHGNQETAALAVPGGGYLDASTAWMLALPGQAAARCANYKALHSTFKQA